MMGHLKRRQNFSLVRRWKIIPSREAQFGKPAQIRWWRGSHRDSRRTFVGKELASFKVMGSASDRVTAASFPKAEWTDVPDSWISLDALEV